MRDIEMQFIADKVRLAVFIYRELNLLRFSVQAAGEFKSQQAAGSGGVRPSVGVCKPLFFRNERNIDNICGEFAESIAEVIHQIRW